MSNILGNGNSNYIFFMKKLYFVFLSYIPVEHSCNCHTFVEKFDDRENALEKMKKKKQKRCYFLFTIVYIGKSYVD